MFVDLYVHNVLVLCAQIKLYLRYMPEDVINIHNIMGYVGWTFSMCQYTAFFQWVSFMVSTYSIYVYTVYMYMYICMLYMRIHISQLPIEYRIYIYIYIFFLAQRHFIGEC